MDIPNSKELIATLRRKAKIAGCRIQTLPIQHKAGVWHQLRIADKRTGPRQGIFILAAGIHATEVAGPLTIYLYFHHILKLVRQAGLQLVCYPLMNPSGFDKDCDPSDYENKELNIDNESGSAGNNDYLRYLLSDGTWTWNMGDQDHSYTEWQWSSHQSLGQKLPAETLVMHKFLQKEKWDYVKVLADIHQDKFTKGTPAGAYHYPYGDLSRYDHIVERIRPHTTVLANYDFRFSRKNPDAVVRSDKNGYIVHHDGGLGDLACRQGVPHALTIETTGATELNTAIKVNLIWIEELIKLGCLEK